ncbi:MAG: hypothetical protein VKO44_04400 [Cyanobacteriota bacterium]|nr:hypothetical protein [Cyanobacteriota bacterium]
MTAPQQTWTQCQILTLGPTFAPSSMMAVWWSCAEGSIIYASNTSVAKELFSNGKKNITTTFLLDCSIWMSGYGFTPDYLPA